MYLCSHYPDYVQEHILVFYLLTNFQHCLLHLVAVSTSLRLHLFSCNSQQIFSKLAANILPESLRKLQHHVSVQGCIRMQLGHGIFCCQQSVCGMLISFQLPQSKLTLAFLTKVGFEENQKTLWILQVNQKSPVSQVKLNDS